MTSEETNKWFADNRTWLVKWLDKTKAVKAGKHFQTFASSRTIFLTQPRYATEEIAEQAVEDAVEDAVKELGEHMTNMMLFTLVFGQRLTGQRMPDCIDGFLAQAKRLPTAKDKVIIYEAETNREARIDHSDPF